MTTKTPAKTKSASAPPPLPDALPARFTLNPEAFDGMTAATLKMPYSEPLLQFTKWLEGYFERVYQPQSREENGRPIRRKPPYRLLNNVLTACAPTIVHGFEWYRKNQTDKGYRMLAVGKPVFDEAGNVTGTDLTFPTEDQIAGVMRLWLQQWGERPWLRNIIEGEGKPLWETLCEALSQPPDTCWDTEISPRALLETDDGLSYDVIPSLIATLLHETESCIGPNRQVVKWRRMQEANTKRYCIVSDPLPVEFLKKSDRSGVITPKNGYFSYKIEIALQTQASRKQPWLHLSVHCMRYADSSFDFNKRGNEVTILVRAHQARLQNWKVDATLVQLKASPYPSRKDRAQVIWLEDLSSVLAELKARPLEKPGDVYENPRSYWRNNAENRSVDEYYILHAEGYRYKGNKNHSILTGFSLQERAEVLGSFCEGVLCDVITPDVAMRPDARRFNNDNKPAPLHTFEDLAPSIPLGTASKEEENALSEETRATLRAERVAARDAKKKAQRERNRPRMLEAMRRATRGKTLIVALFHREADTLDVLQAALRDALQLRDGEDLPPEVIALTPFIPSPEMTQPLAGGDGTKGNAAEVRRWRDGKLAEWEALLEETFGEYLTRRDVVCAVIVELDKKTHAELAPDRRSIRSVIREMCARRNVLSQMIVTPERIVNNPKRDSGTKGKAQQTVQEITTRQLGGLYDVPVAFYQSVGVDDFGGTLSGVLDVIALSFNSTMTGARYCLATRLRADGTVDVLLPEANVDWMPYIEAGPSLGSVFAATRGSVARGRIRNGGQSRAQLTLPQINGFVKDLLTRRLERPTLVIVEAEKWRSTHDNGGNWWQLQNKALAERQNHLVFGNQWRAAEQDVYEHGKPVAGSTHEQLLGIVRLRADETPQYVTTRADWRIDDATLMRNYFELTGFIDRTTTEVFHYFSIGKLPAGAGKPQRRQRLPDPFKIVSGKESGGGVAYRHPPMVEMVPFFVRPDFASDKGKTALCRIPHYLRFSPAWAMGNLDSPYPLHLGDTLIDDQLCILGLGDD